MMREVHSNLFVGDGESASADIKQIVGYQPGPFRRKCDDCDVEYLSAERSAPHRCLDCALKHIAEHWFIIHAAKEPWHRDALGYTGRGAPPDSPEYLIARRGNELMLNLVDMPKLSEQYTNPIFEAAFKAIDENLDAGKRVLIHCNEGKSRAPTIALLWLGNTDGYHDISFDEAAVMFRVDYPEYDPGAGVEAYARSRWGYVEEITEASD